MPNMDKRSDFEKKYGLNKPKKKVVAKKAVAKKPMVKETTAKPVRKAITPATVLAAKAKQAKTRATATRRGQSGTVTSARAKGRTMGAAAPGVAKAAGVKPYALPKKRKPRPRMGAGVPGFTYGRDTE